MYKINYDFTGEPVSIQKGNMSIPFEPLNRDFRKFLEWNKKQKTPLDYEISIEPTPVEPVETLGEKIAKEVEKQLKVK